MNHTEVNREHVWRLLQGGELIAPIPPLPPRETEADGADQTAALPKSGAVQPMDIPQVPNVEAAPPPSVKKTRTRKKAEAIPPKAAEPGSMIPTESGEMSPAAPSKRGRKKKTSDETGATVETAVKTPPTSNGPTPQASTEADPGEPPAKPKRTRRVGEPKPKRYPVGEQETG